MRVLSRFSFLVAILLLGLAAATPARHCLARHDSGPHALVVEEALMAMRKHEKEIRNRDVWTLIDYDLPFTAVRLWVFDARRGHVVLAESRVSHAWKSGALYATEFSNRPGSNLSSKGSFVTAMHTYEGGYGHSLRVRGLDRGINHHAWERAIIFHPDLGMAYSAGCFMLPDDVVNEILDVIVGGTFVYVHTSK